MISSMQRGGRERQLAVICKHSLGSENFIICLNKTETDYINEYNLSANVFYTDSEHFWKRMRQIRALTNDLQVDLFIAWGILESVMAILLNTLSGVRCVNFSVRHGIRKTNLTQLFRTLVLHLSKYVVANSVAGLRANNLRRGIVLYNGVEGISPLIERRKKKRLRDTLIGVRRGPVLISVANFVPYKDYPTVLRALHQLKSKGHDFYYIMVGDGSRRHEFEELIGKFNLEDQVHLTGRIANVSEYLQISDILIHSSMGEGCSNAILEGMKYGLPIIATAVGGTPEIVTPANALLFSYGDQTALESHLETLISNTNLLIGMGNESHWRVSDLYAVDRMIEKYETIVSAIVNEDKWKIALLTTKVV